MANTRNTLLSIVDDLDESMGLRNKVVAPKFSPVPSKKDTGRMPLRTFGKVEIDRVIPDPEQPRREFEAEEIQRLAESLKTHGQLFPIRVRWMDTLDKWAIISGERRWRAACAANLPTIDCFFVEGEISEAELREQQLVENLLRKDLKPLEEAKAFASLMELNGWNGKQLAEALRVSTSKVSRALALLDLPKSVQEQVDLGTLAKSSAYEISKLRNEDAQQSLIQQTESENLTHANTAAQVKKRRGKKIRKHSKGLSLTFLTENGLMVKVTGKTKVNYHYVEQAIEEALEEVRTRIDNNVKLY